VFVCISNPAYGVENSVSLTNKSSEEVLAALESMATTDALDTSRQ
jgi:hypothetical protein